MASGYWFNTEANAILSLRLTNRNGLWLALHTANPGKANNPGSEVTGGGYERQRITFGDPNGQAVVNTNNIAFSGLPAVTVTWLSVQADQVNDVGVFAVQLLDANGNADPVTVPNGDQFLAAAGDIAFLFT